MSGPSDGSVIDEEKHTCSVGAQKYQTKMNPGIEGDTCAACVRE